MFLQSNRQQRVVRVAVWVAVLGLLFGVLSSIIMATSADAHTALKSVSPKDGTTVDTAPTEVVLTFSEPVSSSFATVTVTGPSGEVGSGRPASVRGAVVTQSLAPDLPNGSYTVAFRVVSEDGHPVSDRTTFRVAAASTPTTSEPSPSVATDEPSVADSPSPSATDSASAGEEAGDGRPVRLGLAVGVAALAVAAGLGFLAANRRRESGEPQE